MLAAVLVFNNFFIHLFFFLSVSKIFKQAGNERWGKGRQPQRGDTRMALSCKMWMFVITCVAVTRGTNDTLIINNLSCAHWTPWHKQALLFTLTIGESTVRFIVLPVNLGIGRLFWKHWRDADTFSWSVLTRRQVEGRQGHTEMQGTYFLKGGFEGCLNLWALYRPTSVLFVLKY